MRVSLVRNPNMSCIYITVILALASGCATTREDRIRENQALFTSWPADIQEDIRNGKIRIGYSKDMVRLALGEPDRKYVRETDTGETSIWGYATQLDAYSRAWPAPAWVYSSRLDGDLWYHRTFARPYWYINEREYEHLRVEFKGDQVASIERLLGRDDEDTGN